MPEVYESGIIDASADRVWAVLRDFAGLRNIAGDILACDIEDARPADQVGVVRRLTVRGGAEVREQLVALSDHGRYFRYRMLPPEPFPMRDYLAKVSVTPITDGGKALVQWSGTFSIPDGEPDDIRDVLAGIYRSGIDGIRTHLTRS